MSLSYIASATDATRDPYNVSLRRWIEMKILNESYERQTRVLFNKILTNGLLGKTANGKLPMANLPKLLNCHQYYWRNSQPKEE